MVVGIRFFDFLLFYICSRLGLFKGNFWGSMGVWRDCFVFGRFRSFIGEPICYWITCFDTFWPSFFPNSLLLWLCLKFLRERKVFLAREFQNRRVLQCSWNYNIKASSLKKGKTDAETASPHSKKLHKRTHKTRRLWMLDLLRSLHQTSQV